MVTSDFLTNYRNQWDEYFSGGKIWNENINQYERIAWVIIYGIPASLRNKENLKAIASRIGEVVEMGDISIEDSDLSMAQIGIIVNSGQMINTEVEVAFKESIIKLYMVDNDITPMLRGRCYFLLLEFA